ncbi:hypothetical protein EWM64_g2644 [Hericium alpestre]|uniref:O-methylsterigmatocystin oxidoreductase n=1 Tax=Hericium alpestre TaxID=135208 RepID=A0A4Z0A2V4_9AGAM|nr:hypothetical protein EWM64_g2644 [Hericium alpestre]
MVTYTVLLNVVLAGFVLFLVKRLFDRKASAPMPPGPKGLPIIGNLFDLPRKDEYTVFGEWHKKYGPISSATVFGRSLIVLNTPKVATEMLAKKANIYSDRPYFTMAGDLVGWKDVIVLLPYKARFKAYRKMMHQVLGSRANILKFREHIESETQKAMRRLLDEPENFVGVVRKAIGYIVLLVTYGYKCTSEHDPIVRVADEATTQLGILLAAGGFLVDRLPFLRHVPDWVPGARFKALAREWRRCLYSLTNWTYDYTLAQMSAGTSSPNFVANLLESGPRSDEEKRNIRWAASSLYSGGADTPVSTLSVFFLAMAKYPEAVKKAQAEIDAVIGNDRLPTFEDRDKLPYVNALAKEVIRWGPTAPLGP